MAKTKATLSLNPLRDAANATVEANAEVIGEKLATTLKTLIKEGSKLGEHKELKLQILRLQRDLRNNDKDTKLTGKILNAYYQIADQVNKLKTKALDTKIGKALQHGGEAVVSREHAVELLEEIRDRKVEQTKAFSRIGGDIRTGLINFLGPGAPIVHTIRALKNEYSDEFAQLGKWLKLDQLRNMLMLKRLDNANFRERMSFSRMMKATSDALKKFGAHIGGIGGIFGKALELVEKLPIGKFVSGVRGALTGLLERTLGIGKSALGVAGGALGKLLGRGKGLAGGLLGKAGGFLGKAGGMLGRVAGFAGKALGPIGAAVGLGDIFLNSRDKGKTGEGALGDYVQGGLSGLELGSMAGPIGAAVGLALGIAATAVVRNWSTVKDAMTKSWDSVTSVVKGGWDDLVGFKNDAVSYVGSLWTAIKTKADTIVKWLSDHIPGFDTVAAPIQAVGSAVAQTGRFIGNQFSTGVSAAAAEYLPGVQKAASWVSSNIGGVVGQAAQGVSKFVGKLAMPSGEVGDAISNAAKVTGVSQSYLLAEAAQESGFRADAGAATSSAKGLYQFTDGTWATMVKKYGAQYGIGLNDRLDPRKNAIMGALFARDNAKALAAKGLGTGATELYAAHFLGAGGAAQLLSAMKQNPNAIAAAILPQAAQANHNVFYNKDGSPKTVAQVYQFLNDHVGAKASAYAQATGEGKATPKADEYSRVASQKPAANVTVAQTKDKGAGNVPGQTTVSKGTTIKDMPLAVGDTPFLVMQSSMIG